MYIYIYLYLNINIYTLEIHVWNLKLTQLENPETHLFTKPNSPGGVSFVDHNF